MNKFLATIGSVLIMIGIVLIYEKLIRRNKEIKSFEDESEDENKFKEIPKLNESDEIEEIKKEVTKDLNEEMIEIESEKDLCSEGKDE
jgi:hypothetical protein